MLLILSKFKATATKMESASTEQDVTTEKNNGPVAPTYTLTDINAVKDNNSITINTIATNEYKLVKKGTPETLVEDWSTGTGSSRSFKNLDPNAEYTLYIRVKETDTTKQSSEEKLDIKTEMNPAPVAPTEDVGKETIKKTTSTSLVIETKEGYEYEVINQKTGEVVTAWFDGDGQDKVIDGLEGNVEYKIYYRFAQTETTNASAVYEYVVKTASSTKIGWLVVDIVFAAFTIAILFFGIRRKRSQDQIIKAVISNLKVSVLPLLALFGSVGGPVIFVILLVIIIVLIYIFYGRDGSLVKNIRKIREEIQMMAAAKPTAKPEEINDDMKKIISLDKEVKLSEVVACANALKDGHLPVRKADISDYLEKKYNDKVELCRRNHYVGKSKLPLADTHYVKKIAKSDGKATTECFAYVYEVENNSAFLLLRINEEMAKTISAKHPLISKSTFPKGACWYSVIIDNSFKELNEVYALVDLAKGYVESLAAEVTEKTAETQK